MADDIFPQEIWKPVPGLEYEASSLGRIKRTKTNRVLSLYTNKLGYQTVNLLARGWSKPFFVHDLVARAFHGKRPLRYEIDHVDTNRSNNKIENLEYVTHQENCRRAERPKGSKHSNAKLTEEQVREIRQLEQTGQVSVLDLMQRFNVERKTLFNIRSGKTWAHVVDVPAKLTDLRNGIGRREKGTKLKGEDVRTIRRLSEEGVSSAELAKHFGVQRRAIEDAQRGRSFKHIIDVPPSTFDRRRRTQLPKGVKSTHST